MTTTKEDPVLTRIGATREMIMKATANIPRAEPAPRYADKRGPFLPRARLMSPREIYFVRAMASCILYVPSGEMKRLGLDSLPTARYEWFETVRDGRPALRLIRDDNGVGSAWNSHAASRRYVARTRRLLFSRAVWRCGAERVSDVKWEFPFLEEIKDQSHD